MVDGKAIVNGFHGLSRSHIDRSVSSGRLGCGDALFALGESARFACKRLGCLKRAETAFRDKLKMKAAEVMC